LSIREDLLNKYAEDIVNYCTAGFNNSIQDTLASNIDLLYKKEQEIVHLENEIENLRSELFDYREKHMRQAISRVREFHEDKCKYRKYSKLFWFMVILYVARILITTV
jgi:hypothetical protein